MSAFIPTPEELQALFFDFDGVIVESNEVKTRAFEALFAKEGREVACQVREVHLANLGVSRFVKIEKIYREILHRELLGQEKAELLARFSELVLEGVLNAPYVEGALDILEKSRGRWDCYLISATPQKELEQIVKKRGLRQFFEAIFGSPSSKEEILRELLEQKGLSSFRCLYVGDSLADYSAASACQIPFVERVSGEAPITDASCLKVKDLAELAEVLELC